MKKLLQILLIAIVLAVLVVLVYIITASFCGTISDWGAFWRWIYASDCWWFY